MAFLGLFKKPAITLESFISRNLSGTTRNRQDAEEVIANSSGDFKILENNAACSDQGKESQRKLKVLYNGVTLEVSAIEEKGSLYLKTVIDCLLLVAKGKPNPYVSPGTPYVPNESKTSSIQQSTSFL